MHRYQRAVEALLEAYSSGKLCHGDHAGCAAQVIVERSYPELREKWWYYVMAYKNRTDTAENRKVWKKLQKKTGYTIAQIAEIEAAYEGAEIDLESGPRFGADQESRDPFEGLSNVLDLLSAWEEESTWKATNNVFC